MALHSSARQDGAGGVVAAHGALPGCREGWVRSRECRQWFPTSLCSQAAVGTGPEDGSGEMEVQAWGMKGLVAEGQGSR